MSTQLVKLRGTPANITQKKANNSQLSWLRSPLWLFLFIALSVRIYLIIHTKGVIDADEGLVGIQAEHILRGELPVYFYGQAYMGSLEAYFAALIFALVGPSVWALRAEPTLLSLVVVWLTWKLACDLARRTSFSAYTQRWFSWSATLVAAILPLYDLVIELRTWGGWIEIFVVMLLLLLSALHFVDHWQAGASSKELVLRWAGIGFLIGLGFWLYPLVIIAVATTAIWIFGGFLVLLLREQEKTAGLSRHSFFAICKGLLLAVVAFPSALIGAAPALYWGAQHNWANITFILQLESGHPSLRERLRTIYRVTKLFQTCITPRVIGGSLNLETGLSHTLHLFSLYAALFCIVATVLLFGGSLVWQSVFLMHLRRALALPLLFGVCIFFVFITSSASVVGTSFSCDQDVAGRYAAPFMLALPFFFASTIAAIVAYGRERGNNQSAFNDVPVNNDLTPEARIAPRRGQFALVVQGVVAVLFMAYLGIQLYTYQLADPRYTFQSPYCKSAPANDEPIIAYLEREHIHFAWATNFIGNPIIFKTNSKILAVDPAGVLLHVDWLNRIPADTQAVLNADRPSIIIRISSEDTYPQVLKLLDSDHITYRTARFPSEPGTDVLVVTPLNRNVPLFTSTHNYDVFGCFQ